MTLRLAYENGALRQVDWPGESYRQVIPDPEGYRLPEISLWHADIGCCNGRSVILLFCRAESWIDDRQDAIGLLNAIWEAGRT